MMPEPPTGTVTFLFTDLEISTRLWDERQGNFEQARATLHAIGELFDRSSVSPMTGTVVAGFGILAHLEGDDERARTLLQSLTATRAAASTAILQEVLAEMDGWSDQDFATRRTERVIQIEQHQEGTNRADFFATLSVNLRQELSRSTLREPLQVD